MASQKVFVVQFVCENASFHEDCSDQIPAILRQVADWASQFQPPFDGLKQQGRKKLYDINGNCVGYAEMVNVSSAKAEKVEKSSLWPK